MDTTYLMLGINHKKASLELREKINIPQSLIPRVQNEIQLLLKSKKSEHKSWWFFIQYCKCKHTWLKPGEGPINLRKDT